MKVLRILVRYYKSHNLLNVYRGYVLFERSNLIVRKLGTFLREFLQVFFMIYS